MPTPFTIALRDLKAYNSLKHSQRNHYEAVVPRFGIEMWIITRGTLRDFWETHADAEAPLKEWFQAADRAEWKSPEEIKTHYPGASILPGNRVVFNIKGNDYRLVVKIHYNTGVIFIRFVGTHAEYDKIDATTI